MANHCIDVICLECGAQWCVRGCGFDTKPSKEAIEAFLKHKQDWVNQYHFGKPIENYLTFTNDSHCGKKRVVMC